MPKGSEITLLRRKIISAADLPQNIRDFSAAQIVELEQSLLEMPDDFEARSRLLLHYMMAAFTSEAARQSHLRHVLWVIRHHPESDLAGTPFVLLHHGPKKDVDQARSLWKEAVAAFPDNARVWGNGGKFLLYSPHRNKPQTQEWLQTAARLNPTDPEWPQKLGLLADFERRDRKGQKSKDAARRALHHYEHAYELTQDSERQALLMNDLAQNAFAVEDFAKASHYATELLKSAASNEDGARDWNYGNALHWSHIVLGKVACRQGDREAAKEHLRAAGETPGSPQLNSFGPDTSLAKALLAQGEAQAVIAYFEACSRFWVMGTDSLAAWISAIREGHSPDFSSGGRP